MMRSIPALVLVLCACRAQGAEDESPFDLLIINGRIVDGTGNPWFKADVAIRGDRIAAIGGLESMQARRIIDARGQVVSPGFIDMHSHSDWTLFEDGNAQSKIRQGVTTEILGEGDSGGPFFGKLPPRSVPALGSTIEVATLGAYFNALKLSRISVNIASYVGLDNIWQSVMGTSFERPKPEQLESMELLLDAALEDGAIGLSTMLAGPPGLLATTEDLIQLCKVVKRRGGSYSSHIRNEGTEVFKSIDEAIRIGEEAGVPVDIIHLKIADQRLWGRMAEIAARIEAARARGVDVRANVYPYTRGNNNLASIIPPWAHEGGNQKLLERLRDPAVRVRLKKDILEGLPGWYNHYLAVGGAWSRMLVNANLSAANKALEGLTLDDILARRSAGKGAAADPLDMLFDFLLEENGSISAIYAHHTEEDMRLALSQPWCSIGSDGYALAAEGPLRRGMAHPRSFGTFPRILGVYVREHKVLRLEDAIRKMTSLNAAKAGLRGRGLIQAGYFADICIFDAESVADRATYTAPFQYPAGIRAVIVNGQVVLDQDRHTGSRAGRILRRNQD